MTDKQDFPQNWRIGQDFDPNAHMMNLKGRDYLNVQNRLLWFIRDQRALIVAGLATTAYAVHTEIVEMDHERGYAHFKTYVRDVLGNEATMYGSEAAKDFPDFAEKASTKSLGRALLALGYGTGMAPEMDEGERVVDSPSDRRSPRNTPATLAQDARNKLTSARASVDAQQDIAQRLKDAGLETIRAAREFIAEALGREVDVITLKGGKSDITMGEVSTLLLRLNERANGQHDLKELPVGANH